MTYGSWPSRECKLWDPSHVMNLKLNQSLVSHPHKFRSAFTPAHLADRKINVSHRFCRRVSIPIPPLRVYAGEKLADSGWFCICILVYILCICILEDFARVTLVDFWEFPLHEAFSSPWNTLKFRVSLDSHFLHPPDITSSHSHLPQFQCSKSVIFLLPREIHASHPHPQLSLLYT